MSCTIPTIRTGRPCASCRTAAFSCTHLTLLSGRTTRCSMSYGCAPATALSVAARTASRSSGWTNAKNAVDHASEQILGLLAIDRVRRQPQHLGEQTVVADDAALEVEHEDAVVRRLERGLEQRNRFFQRRAIRHGEMAFSMTPSCRGRSAH